MFGGIFTNAVSSACALAFCAVSLPGAKLFERGLKKATEEWELSKDAEAGVARVFETESDFEKSLPRAVEVMVNERTKRLSPRKAAELLKIFSERIPIPESSFANEDGLTPSFSSLYFEIHSLQAIASPAVSSFIDFHEFQHADHGVRVGRFPYFLWVAVGKNGAWLTPLSIFVSASSFIVEEAYAIGAQWEVLKRLPREDRLRWMLSLDREIERLSVLNESKSQLLLRFLSVTRESLRNADLSKEEFVEWMLFQHGYEVNQVIGQTMNGIFINPQVSVFIGSLWISSHLVIPGFLLWALVH